MFLLAAHPALGIGFLRGGKDSTNLAFDVTKQTTSEKAYNNRG